MQLKQVTRELSERTILLEESNHNNRSMKWNRTSKLTHVENGSDDGGVDLQKEIDELKQKLRKSEKLNEEREQEA